MKNVLIGWKAIANHLEVDAKTAQRYKREKALPVIYDPAGHPVTERKKLDAWRFGVELSS